MAQKWRLRSNAGSRSCLLDGGLGKKEVLNTGDHVGLRSEQTVD
jgi:hypothetical protein